MITIIIREMGDFVKEKGIVGNGEQGAGNGLRGDLLSYLYVF